MSTEVIWPQYQLERTEQDSRLQGAGAAVVGIVDRRLGIDPEQASPPQIAEGLLQRTDFDAVTTRFDRGETWVRDVSMLTSKKRARILEIAGGARGSITDEDLRTIADTSTTFANFMKNALSDESAQPYAGWNFLVNMQGFTNAGIPWARQLDAAFVGKYGRNVDQMLHTLGSDPILKNNTHMLVADFAKDTGNAYSMSTYLAGRSLFSESYQEQLYGRELNRAKSLASEQLQRFAPETGLGRVAQERALGQILRTRFSSYDHLIKGILIGEAGSIADYYGGTLRVQVHSGGNHGNISEAQDVDITLQHELTHSGSAQSPNGTRTGLMVAGMGRRVNEGVVNFLAQEALGFPNMDLSRDSVIAKPGLHYPPETVAMAAMYKYQPDSFAHLYNASYGQVESVTGLTRSVSMFHAAIQSGGN